MRFKIGNEISNRLYEDDIGGDVFWSDEHWPWERSDNLKSALRDIDNE